MRTAAIVALCVATCVASGCATVFNGSTSHVTVTSATPGARVTVDGAPAGVTPTVVALKSSGDHVIVISSPNGETSCRLTASVGAGWVILDVLFGLVPLVVDIATGAWKSLDPESCYGGV